MNIVAALGARTIRRVTDFGDFCSFVGQTMAWLLPGAFKWRHLRLVFPQFYEVATRSVPLVMITGAFVGMVLAVQAVMMFKSVGMEVKLGTVVNMSVLRELGPVLAAVMLAGRVGGGLTAELGTMRVTEQIDALRVMGADPLRVLVVPRFLACTLMIPVLVMYASLTGILGGYGISVWVYGISSSAFWADVSSIRFYDVIQGPIKSVFFGATMSLVCCYKGFTCSSGAAGVGRACTEGFVASCMAILAMDFFVGVALNTIDQALYGTRSFF